MKDTIIDVNFDRKTIIKVREIIYCEKLAILNENEILVGIHKINPC